MEDVQADLDGLLKEAIELDRANKGMLQVYDGERQVLKIVAQIGFGDQFLSLFETVKAFDPSACGRALGLKAPIVIDDVLVEAAFEPFMKTIESEGFRSVKAIPLLAEDQTVVGVLSTHFRDPQHFVSEKGKIPDEHLRTITRRLKTLEGH